MEQMISVEGKVGGGEWWKEGEGTSQTTCVNDSGTWTIERGLTVGEGGLGGGEQKTKIGIIIIE